MNNKDTSKMLLEFCEEAFNDEFFKIFEKNTLINKFSNLFRNNTFKNTNQLEILTFHLMLVSLVFNGYKDVLDILHSEAFKKYPSLSKIINDRYKLYYDNWDYDNITNQELLVFELLQILNLNPFGEYSFRINNHIILTYKLLQGLKEDLIKREII